MEWIGVRRPLSREEVERVGEALDFVLPVDYADWIGAVNGGALRGAWVEIPGVGDVPYARNVPLHREAAGSVYDLFPELGGLFPFAQVGNGDYFCFLPAGGVVLYRHETQTTVSVCDTFSQLMERLHTPENP